MRDDTPYRERPAGEVAREQECMRTIFNLAAPVDLIWEAFGGLGMTAQVLSQRFPEAEIMACDLDAGCVGIYNSLGLPRASCIRGDALERVADLGTQGSALGVSLDFNRLTLLDLWGRREGRWKVDLIQRCAEARPKWLQVTDSAACYLKTNWRKYDISTPTVSDYVGRFSGEVLTRWGLRLEAWSGHSRATYMLFGGPR